MEGVHKFPGKRSVKAGLEGFLTNEPPDMVPGGSLGPGFDNLDSCRFAVNSLNRCIEVSVGVGNSR